MLTTAQLASQTTYTALSSFFERAGYYGMRSILLLYLLDNANHLKKGDAEFLITVFIAAYTLARPIGGLISDLVTGVKLSAIIGLSTMSLGAFALAFGHIVPTYLGMILFILGSALYTPANIAHMLRIYNGRESKTDGALSILYILIFLGSIIGPLLVGLLTAFDTFRFGFICSGVLLLCGLVFTILYKEQPIESQPKRKPIFNINIRTIALIGILFGIIVYWFAYTTATNHFYFALHPISLGYWGPISIAFIELLIGGALCVLWYFVNIRSAWKWTSGVFITSIAIFLCLVFSKGEFLSFQLVVIINVLLILGEMLFAAYWYSLVKRFANPKFLCTIIGCALGISSYLAGLFSDLFQEKYHNGFLGSFFGWAGLVLLGIISLILSMIYKKQNAIADHEDSSLADNSLLDQ
jgi:proton-dependent oligopeptide transporter, POT family